jgi:hypothetical protein
MPSHAPDLGERRAGTGRTDVPLLVDNLRPLRTCLIKRARVPGHSPLVDRGGGGVRRGVDEHVNLIDGVECGVLGGD